MTGPRVWYGVRDLDAARAFYVGKLGFEEAYRHAEDRWMRLVRDGVEIGVAEGERSDATEVVATVDVADAKAEAERLRAEGVEVGVVVEIPHAARVVDVFDPDGNRVQLTEFLD